MGAAAVLDTAAAIPPTGINWLAMAQLSIRESSVVHRSSRREIDWMRHTHEVDKEGLKKDKLATDTIGNGHERFQLVIPNCRASCV
jgi:hypothetical protein